MKKKLLSLALALLLVSTLTLTAFAEKPDASPNVPRSPTKDSSATAPDTKTSGTTMTVPQGIKPVKSYTAVVGKTYKLPDAVKLNCDTFFTSNSKILTVNMETGGFKAVANGTAYIVVVNTTARRYIKVTVGTGVTAAGNKTTTTETTTTTATSGKGALAGYAITVTNKTTLAVKFYIQTTNGVSYAYFATADNTKLGSMTEKDFKTIMDAGLKNGTISYDGGERSLWFANQFNVYRGLTGSATTEDVAVKIDLDAYAQEVIRLTNIEREKNGLPALDVDSDAMAFAQIRAEEISFDFSHTRPNGEIKNVNGLAVAENITKGHNTPQNASNAWLNSSGHRANLMDSNAHSIGVGVYQASNGTIHWVQIIVWG